MKPLVRARSWVWSVVALAAVLGMGAAGCTDLGTNGTDTTVVTTVVGVTTTETGATTTTSLVTTTTLTPATTPTTISVGPSEELLANGHIKACGLIKKVWMDGGVRKLEIDYVDFLTGAAADAAAVAAGEIAPGEHVDNDYFVRNNNTKVRPFTVSNSVAITTYSRTSPIDAADPAVSWNTFYNFWNLVGPPLPADAGMSEGLWWIERSSTAIVSIEQQWVP